MASNSNNSSSVLTCYKAKYNNISRQNKEYYSYIFLISSTPSLPECLMEFCKVALTFESVDETLWSDHSNETSLPVLTHGATCFSKFHKTKFGIFCEILPLATFGSKRVKNRTMWYGDTNLYCHQCPIFIKLKFTCLQIFIELL